MRDNDKRKQLPKRWSRLADMHEHAAVLCRQIANKKAAGRPTLGSRNRLRVVERRGGQYRDTVLRADTEDSLESFGRLLGIRRDSPPWPRCFCWTKARTKTCPICGRPPSVEVKVK